MKGVEIDPFYIADLCNGSTIEFESMCSGSSPLSATTHNKKSSVRSWEGLYVVALIHIETEKRQRHTTCLVSSVGRASDC